MRAIAIPADPQTSLTVVTDAGETEADFGRILGADYIERVVCSLTRRHHLVLITDAYSTLKGKPINERATRLLPGRHLFGDVLVLSEYKTRHGMQYITLQHSDDKVLYLIQH